jgi:hypothetical protein
MSVIYEGPAEDDCVVVRNDNYPNADRFVVPIEQTRPQDETPARKPGGEFKIENPAACGMGLGAECCAYMGAGVDGIMCMRETSLGPMLKEKAQAGSISAQRLPERPYPECQSEGRDGA